MTAAEARKASLEGATVTVKANASAEGKLFGSVGPRDIADAFSAAGKPLNKSEVVMGEGPIRHTGEFEIQIHLHADVHTDGESDRRRRRLIRSFFRYHRRKTDA